MTRHTIPRKMEGLGAYYPGNDFGRQVDLSAKTYVRHEWHGVAGITRTSTYESPTVANTKGSMLFLVPTNRAAFDYRDCLDVYFENVGSFQGRKLNAQMHFDSIKYGPYTPNGKYTVSYSSNPTGVFLLKSYNGPEIFFGRSDQQEWFPGIEQRYDACKDIQVTIRITYADTGGICEIPFYQYMDDIDNNNVWNTYGSQEGITFGSGFTDDLYVYDGFRCSVNDRTIKVPNDGQNHNYSDFYMPPPVPGATSGEHKSDDKRVAEAGWFLNACWGVTTNGQFTSVFHGANAVAAMNIRSPYLNSRIIQEPEKSAIVSSSDVEACTWKISQYLPNLKSEILAPFQTLTFTDVLPVENVYEKVVVRDENETDITSNATVSYNGSTRTVSVSMKPSWLSNANNYGKKVYVYIYCHWTSSASSAQNQATVTIDHTPSIETPIRKVNKAKDHQQLGLHKFVLNQKASYGPGDIVEFMVMIDASSPSRTFSWDELKKYYPAGMEYSDIECWWNNMMSKLQWDDYIPEGLELVGKPKIKRLSNISRTYHAHSGWNTVEDRPLTEEENVREWLQGWNNNKALNIPIRASNWGYNDRYSRWEFDGLSIVDDSLYVNHASLADVFAKWGPLYFMDLDEAYPKEKLGNYDFREYGNGWFFVYSPDEYNAVNHVLVPSDLGLNYGIVPVMDANHVGIHTKGDTLLSAWNKNDLENDDHDSIDFYSALYTIVYYQCRVTGSVTNADVVNRTNVSCESIAFMHYDHHILEENPNPPTVWDQFIVVGGDEWRKVGERVPLSAETSATVHIGGYEITTEVVNGWIDDSVYDLDGGSNVDIGYERNPGYYLESIEVDGVKQLLSGNEKLWRFKNVNRSHHIKVIYAKGYDITTEAVHGRIDAPYYGVKPGDSKIINYVPDEGYMLEKIEVDGNLVDTSTCLDSYLFTNVQANHHIKVTYIPAYKITTSIEHGTITPTITGITPGLNKTVTYTPDSGYYVKSVTVDGNVLVGDALKSHLSSYTFTNIREDHTIHVVCAPYPSITIIKEVENANKIVWAKGSPVFTFMIFGTDYLGVNHSYHRSIMFGRGNGNKKSIMIKIPAGQWTVSELQSDGWTQVSVRAGNSCTVNGLNGILDTRDASSADVTFVNRADDWNGYTENDNRVNQLK